MQTPPPLLMQGVIPHGVILLDPHYYPHQDSLFLPPSPLLLQMLLLHHHLLVCPTVSHHWMDCNSKIYQMMGPYVLAMVLAVVIMSREYFLSLPHLLFVPDVAAVAGLDTAAVEAVRRAD